MLIYSESKQINTQIRSTTLTQQMSLRPLRGICTNWDQDPHDNCVKSHSNTWEQILSAQEMLILT